MIVTICAIGLVVLVAWFLPPVLYVCMPLADFFFGMLCTMVTIAVAALVVFGVQALGLTLPYGDGEFAPALLSVFMPGAGVLMIRIAQLKRDRS